MTDVQVTRVFRWLQQTQKRINLVYGGAGGSKSYSVAQHILLNILCQGKDKRVLVVRKTRSSLKASCWQLCIDLLEEYGIKTVNNKSDLTITRGSNAIMFAGLDDPEKKKSIEFGNYIWIEEATEISADDFRQLKLRLRRKTDTQNQMYLTCNPISALHWIKLQLADKADPRTAICHATYKDAAQFLEQEYIDDLEGLKNEDENFYNVYTLGLWGVLSNIIYTNWQTYDTIPDKVVINGKPIKRINEVTYGLDWGYTAPAALVKLHWYDKNYFLAEEIFYQTKLMTPEILKKIQETTAKSQWEKQHFAGTDEPGSIEELYQGGINIEKAITDVRDGINFCKSRLIGFTKSSTNLIKEATSYKRKEDKDGNVLEEPVKFMDHGMDAMRYGAYTYSKAVKPEILST